MSRPFLEVADIFHRHGAAWRATHAGHLSLGQMKVMSAIETCRTAALGGHVEACEDCGHSRIAYNDRTPDPAAVSRPSLEVADVFHGHGAAWRAAHAGHLCRGPIKLVA